MTDRISPSGLGFIKRWEDFVPHAYDDADPHRRPVKPGDKIKGTLTAGYGTTGKRVQPGMTVTEEDASDWLREDLAEAEASLDRLIGHIRLDQWQADALISLVYNAGPGPLFKHHAIRTALEAGRYKDVPAGLMLYVKTRIGGKLVESAGLRNRRASEVKLWNGQPWRELPPAPVRTIRRGDKGPEVRRLQADLAALGLIRPQDVIGRFGPVTEAAVKFVQNGYGLQVDGQVGPLTRAALAKALAAKGGADV